MQTSRFDPCLARVARTVALRVITSAIFVSAVVWPAPAATATPPAGNGPSAQNQAPTDRRAEFLTFWGAQPRVELPVASDGAAVVIVKFSDFQCPSCAHSYLAYKPVIAKYQAQYPGAIKVIAKEFPLDKECNTSLVRDLHFAACEAAVASRLAHQKGRGDVMDEWLATNSAILTPGGVREAVVTVGGVTDFDQQYAAVLGQVKGDIALGLLLNVRLTPTFYINGIRLEGALPVELFELAIQTELKRAGKLMP